MNDLSLLTNQIIHMNLNDNEIVDEHVNYRWVNRDPNEITELIETVKNDYQSDIILNLFIDISNKMYLVDHRQDLYNIEIDILGSKKAKKSREKYTIMFNKTDHDFTCNCKDFIFRSKPRDIVCKHITFIICKVLLIYDHTFFDTKKLSLDYQKRMSNIIGGSDIWNNSSISIKHLNSEFKSNKKRVLDIEESCPICCDVFSNKETVSCPECFNYVHKECIDIWMERSDKCVYCRSSIFSNYIKDVNHM